MPAWCIKNRQERNFGFIELHEPREFDHGQPCDTLFVHRSDMPTDVADGEEVECMASHHFDKHKKAQTA